MPLPLFIYLSTEIFVRSLFPFEWLDISVTKAPVQSNGLQDAPEKAF